MSNDGMSGKPLAPERVVLAPLAQDLYRKLLESRDQPVFAHLTDEVHRAVTGEVPGLLAAVPTPGEFILERSVLLAVILDQVIDFFLSKTSSFPPYGFGFFTHPSTDLVNGRFSMDDLQSTGPVGDHDDPFRFLNCALTESLIPPIDEVLSRFSDEPTRRCVERIRQIDDILQMQDHVSKFPLPVLIRSGSTTAGRFISNLLYLVPRLLQQKKLSQYSTVQDCMRIAAATYPLLMEFVMLHRKQIEGVEKTFFPKDFQFENLLPYSLDSFDLQVHPDTGVPQRVILREGVISGISLTPTDLQWKRTGCPAHVPIRSNESGIRRLWSHTLEHAGPDFYRALGMAA